MPEETKTTGAELPSLFAIPQEFRNSLPAQVQVWLGSVEGRIDGLHLEDIEEEAEQIAGDTGSARRLFQIARRLFFRRVQEIIRIMDPSFDLEVGVDLPLEQDQSYGGTPGAEADRLISEFGERETMERIGKEQREQERRLSIQKLVRQKVPSFKLPEDFQIPKGMTYSDIAEDILADLAAKKAATA
jgi:hypothetical protein